MRIPDGVDCTIWSEKYSISPDGEVFVYGDWGKGIINIKEMTLLDELSKDDEISWPDMIALAKKHNIKMDYNKEMEAANNSIKKFPFKYRCLYCQALMKTMKSCKDHVWGVIRSDTNKKGKRNGGRFRYVGCIKRRIMENIRADRCPINIPGPQKYPWAEIVCFDDQYDEGKTDFVIPESELEAMDTYHIDGRN